MAVQTLDYLNPPPFGGRATLLTKLRCLWIYSVALVSGALLISVPPDPAPGHFVSMSDLVNSDSPQVKLLLEWGKGFEKRDFDLLTKSLHKDYRHITYPRSLGRPEQTKEEWLGHIAGVLDIRTAQQVELHSKLRLEPLSPLNPSHRQPFIPSQKLRGRSLFTSVSRTFGSTP